VQETSGRRVAELARCAAELAVGCRIPLPDGLQLWRLAGGRPTPGRGRHDPDPAATLGRELEQRLHPDERRRGAHYTPAWLADEVVRLALPSPASAALPWEERAVCDPACGAGAVLLAAARRLGAHGHRPDHVARDLLWGADLDPLAAAVTEAAVTLWSGGTQPAPGHIVAADALLGLGEVWDDLPAGGFGAVVGNPPFQSQLSSASARSAEAASALRFRFGVAASGPYVDTSALFLLLGAELGRPGARVALVQPASVTSARDAAPVRAALDQHAAPVTVWYPEGRPFDAAVRVCVPVLEVGRRGATDWPAALAAGEGVPDPGALAGAALSSMASVVGSFREEYYGLVPHVCEANGDPATVPLVTCGVIDPGRITWGERPTRFARRRWRAPVVDLVALERDGGRAWRHVAALQRPKVVVATQTRVLEAAADRAGTWVPSTPVVSVVPRSADMVMRLTAAVSSPVASAWMARAAAGSGLSSGAFRVSARVLARVPLPADEQMWVQATEAFARWTTDGGDPTGWAEQITRAHGVDGPGADDLIAWWAARLPFPG
jgi:hypothetical protein